MTTAAPILVEGRLRLPEIPERNPDEVTSQDQLALTGNAHHLRQHLLDQGADPETLLITADRWITADFESFQRLARYPDLMVSFDCDPAAYKLSNGYIVTEQGKPPDFVLEIASPSTGRIDVTDKRDDYAALGVAEYWRFDDTGESHGARLAGDRLVDGAWRPIPISELEDGSLQGYSEALNLHLRWNHGSLGWHDPISGRHIITFEDERERAERERAARIEAERRIRELEAELERRP